MIGSCPRCGVRFPKLERLREDRNVSRCPECGLLIIDKRHFKPERIREMASSDQSAFKDLRENRVFGMKDRYGDTCLFFIDESGRIHIYKKCMDCGEIIEGPMCKYEDDESYRVLRLCEKCANERDKKSFRELFHTDEDLFI